MVSCAIYGCSNHSSRQTNFSYHKLPKGKFPEVRQAWLDVIGKGRPERIEAYEKGKRCYVCSKHFLESDYETYFTFRMAYLPEHRPRKIVKRTAVPTQNLICKPKIKLRQPKKVVPKWKNANREYQDPIPVAPIPEIPIDKSVLEKRRNKEIERLKGEGCLVIDDSADVYWKRSKKKECHFSSNLPSTPFRPLNIVRMNPSIKSREQQVHAAPKGNNAVLMAQNPGPIQNHQPTSRPSILRPKIVSSKVASPIVASSNISSHVSSSSIVSPMGYVQGPTQKTHPQLPLATCLPPKLNRKPVVDSATQCAMGSETYERALILSGCDFPPKNRQIWVRAWSELIEDSAENRPTPALDELPPKSDADVQCDIGKEFYAKYAVHASVF